MDLSSKIEALLFFKAEPVKIATLAEILKVDVPAIEQALTALEEQLADRGIRLMRKEDAIMLSTAPEISEVIERLIKEDLEKDLGKAGLETLTIILYRGPVTRAQVDYIRGVNSTYILRHLLVRGLVEKIANPKDSRSFLYRPTFELLSYLGVTKVEDLPEYATVQAEMEAFETESASDLPAQVETTPDRSTRLSGEEPSTGEASQTS